MPLSSAQYQQLFVESGLISSADFQRFDEEAKRSQVFFEDALLESGLFTDDQVARVLSDAYGVPSVALLKITPDPNAVRAIPEIVMRKQHVFPYGWKDDKLQVAMADPSNSELISFLEKKTGIPLVVSYTSSHTIHDALTASAENIVTKILALADQFEAVKGTPGSEEFVVQIVDLIMRYGYLNGASDVHVEPHEIESLTRYRVDGLLHDVVRLPKEVHEQMVARIKIMSNLRTDEHFAAQDGKFRFRVDQDQIDVRVSIVPIVEGEKITMRLLAEKGRVFALENIGLAKDDYDRVKRAADKPYGMLLATGPTGSGKTTSMYSVLKMLNTRDVNIQTIEDPVEYDMEGVNQIQVNARTNLTFAQGLRSIVRQDPDIILVGEIRDEETASIAVNAAMTGHLVLSTLHTNDAATTLPRLLDMGIEPFLIASSVNVIIAQRLVRRICSQCVISFPMEADKIKASLPPALFAKYFGKKKGIRLYKGKGCPVCNGTGFKGRQGIFEVLEVTDPVRKFIMTRADASVIQEEALKEGMTTMFEDGLRKVIEGITTIEEVLRVAKW